MFVKIGPYPDWIGPYQIADKIFFWIDRWPEESLLERWDYRLHDKFGRWLADTWVNDLCHWIHGKKKRKVDIRIDRYDTWSMDHTLSLIVIPMLKQLKDEKHGHPIPDVEDAPHIGKGDVDPGDGTDSLASQRWDWIMGEMIWAHEQIVNESDHENYYVPYEEDEEVQTTWFLNEKESREMGRFDRERFDLYNKRIENGLRLFGKYYRSLWD